ncbi:MAG: NAD-dependent epimerase/dehydratase family protein, partial [Bacteroidota bacterium]
MPDSSEDLSGTPTWRQEADAARAFRISPEPVAFVTGGTGFVGSHLADHLIARGYVVRGLVRSAPKWLPAGAEVVHGDLDDAEALSAGASGADLVLHVAGLTRARDQETLDRANVAG